MDTGWEWLLGGNHVEDNTSGWMSGYNKQNGYASGNRDLNYSRSNAMYGQLTGGGMMDPSSWYGRAAGLMGMQGNALQSSGQMAGRSGQSIWDTFSQSLPGMQSAARGIAGDATSLGAQSLSGLADLQAANAGARTAGMLSRTGIGGHSGAAAGAIARATAEPLLNAQSQIGQMYNNSYMSALSPLAQAGYSRELNRTNEFLNMLQGLNQTQGNYGSMASPLMNALAEQSQQQILAPQLQRVQTQGLLPMIAGAALTGGAGQLGKLAGSYLVNALGGGAGSGLGLGVGALSALGLGDGLDVPSGGFNLGNNFNLMSFLQKDHFGSDPFGMPMGGGLQLNPYTDFSSY